MKKIVTTFGMLMFMFSVMAIANAGPPPDPVHYCVTAAKANEMVKAGAILIDCRTLEEYYFVGNPAKEIVVDGEKKYVPIAYNIPYKLWTSRIDCAEGLPLYRTVERLFGFLVRCKFRDLSQRFILMSQSGIRSSAALEYLYSKGYNDVYEIDNFRKEGTVGGPGGRGGFQGSDSNCPAPYVGYRGWPGRVKNLTNLQDPEWLPGKKNLSVSWMDTGLPITQDLDCCKIWKYMWRCKCGCK